MFTFNHYCCSAVKVLHHQINLAIDYFKHQKNKMTNIPLLKSYHHLKKSIPHFHLI